MNEMKHRIHTLIQSTVDENTTQLRAYVESSTNSGQPLPNDDQAEMPMQYGSSSSAASNPGLVSTAFNFGGLTTSTVPGELPQLSLRATKYLVECCRQRGHVMAECECS